MTIPPKYEDVVAKIEAANQRDAASLKDLSIWKQKACEAAEREAALREELDNHDCATLLINAWVDAHGKQIPWDKAIEIIAVATKMPDAEKTRLLCLDDQYELLQQRLTVAEQRAGDLEAALKFYADGDHLLLADADAWDTCSGEPINFLHDEAGTASVEDGSIAKAALKPAAEGEGS